MECAHAGYVGTGLLSAAVCGDVFASPSTDAVLAAIRRVGGPAGVLLVVKNYTGDRLNFGLAAELARAEGIPTAMIVVDDDLSLTAAGGHAGRRGLAGTVLVHKIVGAAAVSGQDLEAVAAAGRDAIADLGTVGLALSGCSLPGATAPGFKLGPDDVELGLGIHGERGVGRFRMQDAASLVREMGRTIIQGLDLRAGERVAILVNGLGGTPNSELLIVARSLIALLDEHGVTIERSWVGSFLTALDMQGCSISLLRVTDDRIALLDAAASAPAWPGPGTPATSARQAETLQLHDLAEDRSVADPVGRDEPVFRRILLEVVEALRSAEPELTRLDQAVGDGDLGLSLSRGAAAIEAELPTYDLSDQRDTLERIAGALRRVIGGTSGPLYAVFLMRAAGQLSRDRAENDLAAWASALDAGSRAIGQLGDASPGDRTMLDALAPAAAALSDAASRGATFAEAAEAAAAASASGAAATRGMHPRRGRSSYLADRVGAIPDPGAVAVWVWLTAIAGSGTHRA